MTTQALDAPQIVEGETEARPLRVLIIEDDEDHAFLVESELSRAGGFEVETFDRLEPAIQRLHEAEFDVVLTDYMLPDGRSLDSLPAMKGHAAVALMTGRGDEETAASAVKQGAADYIVKDGLWTMRLPDALQRAVRERRAHQEIKRLRIRLREENHRLKDANRRLEALSRVKDDFLATVSHELRTPLTVIRECICMLDEEALGELNRVQKEFTESALSNTDRLGRLVDDVLALQKIEVGGLRLRRRSLGIDKIINACAADVRPRFTAKAQTLNIEVERDLPPVLADGDALDRVIVNLVGNANKFTPHGGTVTVRVHRDDDGRHVRVQIDDNGPGIPKAERERIFRKFTQVRRNTNPEPGTGLGLAIVHRLVAMHEGEIRAESAPGGGSRFTFALPIYDYDWAMESFVRDAWELATTLQESICLAAIGTRLADGVDVATGHERVDSIATSYLTKGKDDYLYVPEREVLLLIVEDEVVGADSLAKNVMDAMREDGRGLLPTSMGLTPYRPNQPSKMWIEETLKLIE